jgi:hypothetical protein
MPNRHWTAAARSWMLIAGISTDWEMALVIATTERNGARLAANDERLQQLAELRAEAEALVARINRLAGRLQAGRDAG